MSQGVAIWVFVSLKSTRFSCVYKWLFGVQPAGIAQRLAQARRKVS